ncbi:glycosyltransferase [Modicisalibacter radicis]|uniref:glycosyltransferase n=1 Tax=Halomonas sp. EAR18 TaxID=2518972 RepID=UPI00109CEE5B|nr:glycosyltransferase [Halomonas sp. EAR18]
MKCIYIFSFSFESGGAAIAAKKFANLAKEFSTVTCVTPTSVAKMDDGGFSWQIVGGKLSNKVHFIKRIVSYLALKLFKDDNVAKHSLNIFSSSLFVKQMRKASKENAVCNLHWVNNDCISVFKLDELPPRTIITLHDEWLYCGAEHYYPLNDSAEMFSTGYSYWAKGVRGINWNWLVWKIKYRKLRLRNDLVITVPSVWMYERAKRSLMLRNLRIELLPNPIETSVFSPLASGDVLGNRQEFGVDEGEVVIAIGAVGGNRNRIKGFGLLEKALEKLSEKASIKSCVKIISFGGDHVGEGEFGGFRIRYLGKINDASKLRRIYAIADFVVVPSFVESFGQVAAEALSCQTPVVAFRCSGLQDIVINKENGLLAEPFSTDSLAIRMQEMILMPRVAREEMGLNGRHHVSTKFSPDAVRMRYQEIVSSICQ